MKSERNFPTSTHQSDQLKSMEAQIQILVENMQTLQTKLTSMENKQRTRPQNTETRTCYNCDRPGHLAKDCRKPKRLRLQNQNRSQNANRNFQSETGPLNEDWAGSIGVNPTRNSTHRLEKHVLEETRPRSVRQTSKKISTKIIGQK